jgi:hypothetical protein
MRPSATIVVIFVALAISSMASREISRNSSLTKTPLRT